MKKKILNIDLDDIDLSPSQIIYFTITNSIIIMAVPLCSLRSGGILPKIG